MSRKVVWGALVTGAAVTALGIGTPGAATAASNPYTPTQICGARYAVVAKAPVKEIYYPANVAGWLYVMRKPGTKRFCATTIKTRQVGKKSLMIVRHRWPQVQDEGSYTHYAGPLRWFQTDCTAVNSYMFFVNRATQRQRTFKTRDIHVRANGQVGVCDEESRG